MLNNISTSLTIQNSAVSGQSNVLTSFAKNTVCTNYRSLTQSFSSAVNVDIQPTELAKVYVLFIRVINGDLTFKITTAAGTDQIVPCDTAYFRESHIRYITNVTVSGTGDAEIFMSGEN